MLFAANGIVAPQAFFGMNVALACGYTVLLLLIDWKQDADRFVASLPVSREDVVKARYVGALGAAACGTVLYAVYGRVLLGFGGERLLRRWPDTPGWESAEGLLTFFLTVWLVSVAYLPFYFRWALAKGTGFFAGSVAVVTLCGTILAPRLSLPWTLTGFSEGVGSAASVVVALAVAAALGWLSLRLALRSYDRRDI
jgi:ABC-type Na+ efflux pump permease subunit